MAQINIISRTLRAKHTSTDSNINEWISTTRTHRPKKKCWWEGGSDRKHVNERETRQRRPISPTYARRASVQASRTPHGRERSQSSEETALLLRSCQNVVALQMYWYLLCGRSSNADLLVKCAVYINGWCYGLSAIVQVPCCWQPCH